MKKILFSVFAFCMMLIFLTGCSTYKSYTFNVSTGDKVKIKMVTSSGYDLTSNTPIKFSKDGETISQGTFAQGPAYIIYRNSAKSQGAKILKEDSNKTIDYFFYEYNNNGKTEYNYIIKIKDSNTCFILASQKSQEEAEEIFSKLEFSLE